MDVELEEALAELAFVMVMLARKMLENAMGSDTLRSFERGAAAGWRWLGGKPVLPEAARRRARLGIRGK